MSWASVISIYHMVSMLEAKKKSKVAVDSVKQQVLVQSGDRWVIASLEQLVEMHYNQTRGNQ